MVSIIVPAYNAEKYIDKCIDSLVNQTYSDIQIIVVDDGSKDNTWSRLSEWAAKDSRVVALHYDNSGVVATRQRGLEHAAGELLMFVDADDYLPADAVGTLVDAMRDSDLCVGSYTLVWAPRSGDLPQTPVDHPKRFSTPSQCAAYCLKYGETFLPIKLFRTDLFRNAVKIPTDICVQEDTIGTLQYLAACQSVSHTDRSIYFYLKHPDSASYNLSSRHLNSLLKVATMLCDMYSSCDDADLIAEVKNSCLKNAFTYTKLTDAKDLDRDSINKILHFIETGSTSGLERSREPSKVLESSRKSISPSKYNYKHQAIKTSLKYPKAGRLMFRAYDTYTDIKKKTKACLRKIIK